MQWITAMAEKLRSGEAHKIQKCEENCCAGPLHAVFTPEEKRLLEAQTFGDCEFNKIDFSNADLWDTRFVNVSLTGCDFSDAEWKARSCA